MANVSKKNVINGVLFQGTWFACVLGGAQGLFWPGAAMVAAMIFSLANAPSLRHDLLLALVLVPVGGLLDTGWIMLGVLDYHSAALAPTWIILMWLAVALTINHSLAFFRDRPWLGAAAVLGAAPLSYLAGERFGAVTVPEPWWLIAISLSWGLLFLLLFRHARARSLSEPALPADQTAPRIS